PLTPGSALFPYTTLFRSRVAQVRLVGAVLAHRDIVRNARPVLRDRLAVGELLEHRRHDRLHRRPDVFLGNEAHLDVELVELARQDRKSTRLNSSHVKISY